jgi:RNA polymerase sigma-70 factor, ECF subfamily
MTPHHDAHAFHDGLASYDNLEEAELVELARRGHRDAFRVITQRCNQRLFRVARAIVQNESEAEDVVQAAYLRAFAGLEAFRGEASIRTWLTRITLNEARGRLRTRRNTVNLDQIDIAHAVGAHVIPFSANSDAEGPEAHTARLQIGRLIEQAVDGLPPLFRIVFVMREIEDCSILETADLLGIPPETVKTRLHRARRLLRLALDEKIGQGATGAFPFLGTRCQRITAAVLERLDLSAKTVNRALAR